MLAIFSELAEDGDIVNLDISLCESLLWLSFPLATAFESNRFPAPPQTTKVRCPACFSLPSTWLTLLTTPQPLRVPRRLERHCKTFRSGSALARHHMLILCLRPSLIQYPVGNCDAASLDLIATTKESLKQAIAACKPGVAFA